MFCDVPKASGGKGFRRMNGDSTYCSRKAAKPAKKNNEMNLLKNLRVFAPLRETFSVPACPAMAGLSGLGKSDLYCWFL